MKKPDKKTRPAEKVPEPELNEVLSKLKEDTQHRIEMLSSISAKAADVLKFALTELKTVKEHADHLNSMKIMDSVKMDSFEDAVEYISVMDKDFSEAIDGEEKEDCKPAVGVYDATNTKLIQFLFRESKFAIDPGEMSAYRQPALDKDGAMAYEFVANASTTNNESTFSYQESFVAFLYPDMRKTLSLFDEKVASLNGIRFLTKEEDARNKAERNAAVREFNEAAESLDRKVDKDIVRQLKRILLKKKAEYEGSCRKECKCGKCRCHKERKVENAVNALTTKKQLDGFKKWLLDNSKYAIPSTRFQVLFDKVDRKSRKFVYELRFFQKSYKNDETQSYERSVLRVRMNGDCDERILDRFDKTVSELRFNEFKEKKNVR